VLALETESLGWQRLEERGFDERIRPPEFLIYRAGKEIVARDRGAYTKIWKWRDFLSRTRRRVVWDSYRVIFGLTG
jgi:hypothetical protein